MDEIKSKAIDEKRLNLLKEDLTKLREETYRVVDVDYDKMTITISGILFDLNKWNCLYINPHCDSGCILLEY